MEKEVKTNKSIETKEYSKETIDKLQKELDKHDRN